MYKMNGMEKNATLETISDYLYELIVRFPDKDKEVLEECKEKIDNIRR